MVGFLERYDLAADVRVNIEVNHATLAGHSFHHEVAAAIATGSFGSIDANRGDPRNGWDTDQFPNSVEEMTLAFVEILRAGGLTSGGVNFDTKLRRASIDRTDLFHGHIGAMDTVARALLVAAAIIEDGTLDAALSQRYESWSGPLGRTIMDRETTLGDLRDEVLRADLRPRPSSGRQEALENLVNRFVHPG